MATPSDIPAAARAADLLRLPDDGCRYELVGGQLLRDRPAGFQHGALALHLGHLLWTWARQARAGVVCAAETGFRLRSDPDTVRAPDVAFVARSRIPADGGPDGFWDGSPDLAVEVLSPHDPMVEVLDKVRDYLEAGAQQVWVVAPGNRTVTVYRSFQDVRVLTEADDLVGDGPVAGFRCRLRELFAPDTAAG